MSEMLPNNPLYDVLELKYWNWIQFALSIPVVFYATWMFFERAYRSIKTWNLNMFTLIGIGAGVAWLFSVFGMLVPDFFPNQFKTEAGTVHVYFEAATVILTLVLLGQLLEASAQLGAAQANAAGGDSQIIAAKAGHVQAEAAVLQAGAELEKARAVLHAELIHLNRMIHLHEQDAATDAQLESARRDHSQALGDVDIGEKAVTSARAMEGAAAAKIQVAESQKEALVSLVAVAEAAIASANARVDLATTMVGYTRIHAPFSGIITERFLDPKLRELMLSFSFA
jgi:hypothetical protein